MPEKQSEGKMEKYSKYISKKEAQEMAQAPKQPPKEDPNTISNVNISIEELECIHTPENDQISSLKDVPGIISKGKSESDPNRNQPR